jgi:formylmethanofuran dehydrogenase subunit B
VPTDVAPLLLQRCGIGEALVAARHLVVLHPRDGDVAVLAPCADEALGVTVEAIDAVGDLPAALGWLNVALARPAVAASSSASVPHVRHAPPVLRALAERLQRARYAVFIGAPAHLPVHGALVVEAVHRAMERLNRTTRAAALWLDGGNGAATANQVFAWLSGLPLRSRAGPRGLEHEPLLFGAGRLLDAGAVDVLLWVSAFEAAALPPPCNVPLIVLGHPAQATACARRDAVFIPVSTPGIGSDGHVFRTDGTVLMPLHALRPDALPSVADVAQRLLHALRGESVA